MKFIILATLLLAPCLHAAPKTAEEIMLDVRQSYAGQNQKLQGELRDGDSGRTEPLELTMGNQAMNFLFTNPPAETIRLDFQFHLLVAEATGGRAGEQPVDAPGDIGPQLLQHRAQFSLLVRVVDREQHVHHARRGSPQTLHRRPHVRRAGCSAA